MVKDVRTNAQKRQDEKRERFFDLYLKFSEREDRPGHKISSWRACELAAEEVGITVRYGWQLLQKR